MSKDDDFVAEYVAHPALVTAFRSNHAHIEALRLFRPPHQRPPQLQLHPVFGFLSPKRMQHVIARSRLCVMVCLRLVRHGRHRVKFPPKHAACILSRCHLLPAGTRPPDCHATLQGHSGTVFSVAFHASAALVATGSSDKTAKLWRLHFDGAEEAYQCSATLRGHGGWVMSVAFHPRLCVLATGSSDHTARLWRLNSNFTAAACVAVLRGHSDRVRCVAFHPLHAILATASADNTAKLWHICGHEEAGGFSSTHFATLEGHSACVNAAAFHPHHCVVATGSDDETAKLWRFDASHGEAACSVTLHGNKTWVQRASTLQGNNNLVLSVAFQPSSTGAFATACDDGTVKLWRLSADFTEATCVSTVKGHGSSVYCVAFHPHASIMMTGSEDDTARIWQLNCDSTAASCVACVRGDGGSVLSVAFHPRAAVFATGSYGCTAKVWR